MHHEKLNKLCKHKPEHEHKKKCIISGTLKYSEFEKVRNAVVIVYRIEFSFANNISLIEAGYTTTNEHGEFHFTIDVERHRNVDYIIEFYDPLVRL